MENTEIYTNITIREERNKMKKFTVCLLIGAMAASMLTGCGSNGGSSDSSDSKADSSSETMTIMMNGSDSDAYMEGYRKIIDGFNESNEYGVKVEIQNVTNSDYKTKLTTMMASDSETDIIFTWELGYLENFVNGDKIVSLQKYLDEDEDWKNSFNGGILEPLTYDGEVYEGESWLVNPADFAEVSSWVKGRWQGSTPRGFWKS